VSTTAGSILVASVAAVDGNGIPWSSLALFPADTSAAKPSLVNFDII
jgi:hypothetical protein